MGALPARYHGEPREIVRVLLASASESDHALLRNIFRSSKWALEEAFSCGAAIEQVRTQPVGVVICGRELPDGSWQDLLKEARNLTPPPRIIVSSRLTDDLLWAEVINLGGYDLLTTPFDHDEVVRIVFLAWQSWKHALNRAIAKPPRQESPTVK